MTDQEKIKKLTDALKAIALQGGNQSDDALMTRTGPNDAAARGIMYVNSREIANLTLASLEESVELN